MHSTRHYRWFAAPLLALALLFGSCGEKGEIMRFAVTNDFNQATVSNPGGKTILQQNETLLIWEQDDDIWVQTGSLGSRCRNVRATSDSISTFTNDDELLDGLANTHAIYPYDSKVDDNCTKLKFPAVQSYRSHSDIYADSSFGRGAMPMVCTESNGLPHMLYFHCVGGIARVQFFSSAAKSYTINSITFKEISATPKQISGVFDIHDIDQNEPWLTAKSTPTDPDDYTITIDNINQTIGGGSNLWTFYLVLPAVDGGNQMTEYTLQVTVNLTGSDKQSYVATKKMRTNIRRLNIQMMPALDISNPESNGDISTSPTPIVGNGTKERPFQIYKYEELKRVCDAFKTTPVKVNGQLVTKDTYFKIVRSDIVLGDDWEGFQNFTGHLYFASSTATQGGVTNNTESPLFQSIGSDGVVTRLHVKGSNSRSFSGDYSPFCNVNNGTIEECHNKVNITNTNAYPGSVAGLCLENNGTIKGGANEGTISNPAGNVAGICLDNKGTIQGNFTLSSAVPTGENIAGIAYYNYDEAVVRDCIVSVGNNISATGNWGCIVFENQDGGIIRNCKTSGEGVFSTNGSIGGIAHTNAGVISGCTNQLNITGASAQVGGIVALQTASTGLIYNCCSEGGYEVFGISGGSIATDAGGIVGRIEDGYIINCFNYSSVGGATNSGGVVGFFDVNAKIDNCWTGYAAASNKKFSGNHAEGANLGYNCYTDAGGDYQCTLYEKAFENGVLKFRIITLRSGLPTGYGVVVGDNLVDALNDWSSLTHRFTDPTLPSGMPYYSWREYSATSDRPTFNTSTKSLKKPRR